MWKCLPDRGHAVADRMKQALSNLGNVCFLLFRFLKAICRVFLYHVYFMKTKKQLYILTMHLLYSRHMI